MTDEPDFTFAVSEAVDTFREALVALIPSAERAGLTWHDVNTHDDWERLADAAFGVFVAGPAGDDISVRGRGGLLPLPRYDFDFADYSGMSWLELDASGDEALVFLRLLSNDAPFDTAQFARVDLRTLCAGERIAMPYRDTKFRLRRRFSDGSFELVLGVVLDQ